MHPLGVFLAENGPLTEVPSFGTRPFRPPDQGMGESVFISSRTLIQLAIQEEFPCRGKMPAERFLDHQRDKLRLRRPSLGQWGQKLWATFWPDRGRKVRLWMRGVEGSDYVITIRKIKVEM
jgi:hypothetical protein